MEAQRPTAAEGPTADATLAAGRVGRPHGLDGSFYVTRPRAALLVEGAQVTVGGRPRLIVRRAGTDERPIVRLAGDEDRAGAESMRGQELLAVRGSAPPLAAAEWWAEDLVGCEVHDAHRPVGEVRRLLALPSCEVLEVQRADGGELLVPLVRDAIRSVDVGARRIEINLAFLGEAS